MVDLLEDGRLQIQHKQTDAQHGKQRKTLTKYY